MKSTAADYLDQASRRLEYIVDSHSVGKMDELEQKDLDKLQQKVDSLWDLIDQIEEGEQA